MAVDATPRDNVCTWTYEKGGTWTVIDRCDHASGFFCASAGGRAGHEYVVEESVDTPFGPAYRVTVTNKEFFRERVEAGFARLGWSLTDAMKALLTDPPAGATFEIPCVKPPLRTEA